MAYVGWAVHPDEVETIFRFGTTDFAWNVRDRPRGDAFHTSGDNSRIRHLVTRLERSSLFRREVLVAYGNRCAVSGLSASGIDGLIEAARIRAYPNNPAALRAMRAQAK